MHRSLLALLLLLGGLSPVFCVTASTWRQSEAADFEKGTLRRLALRSDGQLSLALVASEILDASSPYLWALAEDSRGNVYAAGGGPGAAGARIYRITPQGASEVAAEFDALEVHVLAVDRNDRVYAATSPDGRVYRLRAGAAPELFYDPAAKYVWAMVLDAAGNLFIATGDEGLIHRVSPDGRGGVFFRTGQTHARALAIDGRGNLIVGTEPAGLVMRVTPQGEGFVLHQTAKREVTAVAAGVDGSVFAAAAGSREAAPPPPPPQAQPAAAARAAQVTAGRGPAPIMPGQPAGAAAPQPSAPQPPAITGGSEVYRIEPDGYPRRIWSHNEAVVYALALDGEGRPVLGTGNRGTVYRLDTDIQHTTLAAVSPSQVTALLRGGQGQLYAATGSIGKVFRIGPELEKEGTLESEVFDAGLLSRWGRVSRRGEANGGIIRFETRSGNLDRPNEGWSPWAGVEEDEEGGRVASPRARFLQWRMTLAASATGVSPAVEGVYVAYLPRNAAPVVEAIEITAANYRFPGQPLSLTPSRTLTLQPMGRSRRQQPTAPLADSGVVTLQYEKGQIGARWAANDANEDQLLYRVEIRGVAETEWKLLRDKVQEKHLSWDSTAFGDGEYRLRVTATDLPNNPPGQELSSQLVSRVFLIDNSPPQIMGLAAVRAGSRLQVRWTAADATSLIQKAEYSLNGGDWRLALPKGAISDSRKHDYELQLDVAPVGEQTIAVRVTDDYDNQAAAQFVVR